MNVNKIPPHSGYLQQFQPKYFLCWSFDEWGFWEVELLDLT